MFQNVCTFVLSECNNETNINKLKRGYHHFKDKKPIKPIIDMEPTKANEILMTVNGLETVRGFLNKKLAHRFITNLSKGMISLLEFQYEKISAQLRELYNSAEYAQAKEMLAEINNASPIHQFLTSTSGMNGMQILMLNR